MYHKKDAQRRVFLPMGSYLITATLAGLTKRLAPDQRYEQSAEDSHQTRAGAERTAPNEKHRTNERIHTHTHQRAHTHTRYRSLSHTDIHYLTHTHTLVRTHTLSRSLSHTDILYLTHTDTH